MSFLCRDFVSLNDMTILRHLWDNHKFIETFLSHIIIFLCNVLIHRGEILGITLRKLNLNLTKLAEKLPWTVKTIYRHIDERDLPYEKIAEYAKASKYPFTEEFPELEKFNYNSKEDLPIYKDSTDPEYYRLKYEMLLEKHSRLLERYNDLMERHYSNNESGI